MTEVHALVKDIMTADVAAVRSDASYRAMTTLLRARRVSGLPVVDTEGTVVGVVSEARHVEGVVAVRDRFAYPLVTEAS